MQAYKSFESQKIQAKQDESTRTKSDALIYKGIVVESQLFNKNQGVKRKKIKFYDSNSLSNVESETFSKDTVTFLSTPKIESIYLSEQFDDVNLLEEPINQSKTVEADCGGIKITLEDANIEFDTIKHEVDAQSTGGDFIWSFDSSEEDEFGSCYAGKRLIQLTESSKQQKLNSGTKSAWTSKFKSNDKNKITSKEIYTNDVKFEKNPDHTSKIQVQSTVNSSKSRSLIGPDPTLSENEELALVAWIQARDLSGFPVRKIDLVYKAAEIVQDGRVTRFKNGVPGEKWFLNFLARHPNVTCMGRGARSEYRKNPTKRVLKTWFKDFSSMLHTINQADILNAPDKMGTVDCLELNLNSGSSDLNFSNEPISINTLLGACADGTLMPPLPVFSCRRPTCELIDSIPNGWGVGYCKNGKLNKRVVFSYLKNILLPWLKESGRIPFVLFVDQLRDHITMDVVDFCAQSSLLIHNFYANSHDVVQPLHMGIFPNIRKSWEQIQHTSEPKEALLSFSCNLNRLLKVSASAQVVMDSFRQCGIYPFDASAPDYRKCANGSTSKNWSHAELRTSVEIFEQMIGSQKLQLFQDHQRVGGKVKFSDIALYRVWLKLCSQVDASYEGKTQVHEYHHERLLRNKLRTIARPDTYLKVLADESSGFADIGKIINNIGNTTPSHSDTIIKFDIDGSSDTDKCYPVEVWREYFFSNKLKPHRSAISNDEHEHIFDNEMSKETCSKCHERDGRLLFCISCQSTSHFQCLAAEEQQVIEFLLDDAMAFDYLCLACSKPFNKSISN